MASKRAFRFVALVAMLSVVGTVSAAERVGTERASVRGEVATKSTQVQLPGPASATQILRLRWLDTIRLVKALRNAESEPASFGTNGLSDGPDPIDATDTDPGDKSPVIRHRDQYPSTPANGEEIEQYRYLGPR